MLYICGYFSYLCVSYMYRIMLLCLYIIIKVIASILSLICHVLSINCSYLIAFIIIMFKCEDAFFVGEGTVSVASVVTIIIVYIHHLYIPLSSILRALSSCGHSDLFFIFSPSFLFLTPSLHSCQSLGKTPALPLSFLPGHLARITTSVIGPFTPFTGTRLVISSSQILNPDTLHFT